MSLSIAYNGKRLCDGWASEYECSALHKSQIVVKCSINHVCPTIAKPMLAVAFLRAAVQNKYKMEAKDLRIGNIVAKRLKSGNGRTITDKLGCQDIVRIFENTGSFIYEPILLDIDWLMKFGGKPLENGYWISVTNLKAELHFEVFNNTSEIVTTIKSQFSDLIVDRIKYVHELQNLYFSLTKSELGGS